MTKYNLDKLIKVSCLLPRPPRVYKRLPEKKIMGMVTRKSGIYNTLVGGEYLGDVIPINHFGTSSTIYVKPRVILFYEGNIDKTYYFETYDEAKEFADKLTNNKNWIE